MKQKFNLSDIKISKIKELPDAWSRQEYINLLEKLDFEDDAESMSDSDIYEMLVMALQDHELVPAAVLLLEHRLGGRLDEGDIQHLSEEYLHTELWDEHADLSLHEEFFNIGAILHDAFPNLMTEPVCSKISFTLNPFGKEAEEELKGDLPSLLLRLIAAGMDENAKLNRLFEDQVNDGPFPEASSVLWIINSDHPNYEIYLSHEWVKEFPHINSYEAQAFSD